MGSNGTDCSIGVRALVLEDEARVRPSNKTAKAVTPTHRGDPVFASLRRPSLPRLCSSVKRSASVVPSLRPHRNEHRFPPMGSDRTDCSIGVRALALEDEARVRPSNETAKAVTPTLCGDPVFAKPSQGIPPPSVPIREAKRICGSLSSTSPQKNRFTPMGSDGTDCSIGVRALALEDKARVRPSNKTAKAVTPTLCGDPVFASLRRASLTHPTTRKLWQVPLRQSPSSQNGSPGPFPQGTGASPNRFGAGPGDPF